MWALILVPSDLLNDMSLEKGSASNEKLIPISRSYVLLDHSIPIEYIVYDLWGGMRAHNKEVADEVLEPTFLFMSTDRQDEDKTNGSRRRLRVSRRRRWQGVSWLPILEE